QSRAHPRHRQGPQPARHRGALRHGRRVRRHRQARLGHERRPETHPQTDIARPGWGTSYVTNNLEKKIALYRSFDTPVVCGGTLFEAVYGRDKIDEFKRWLIEQRFSHVE